MSASKHAVYALLCSGGSPGIMYVEGGEEGVREWVDGVKRLRYKDYQLLRRPAELRSEDPHSEKKGETTGLFEIGAVKDFEQEMQRRGVLSWWRKAMEFDSPDDRL